MIGLGSDKKTTTEQLHLWKQSTLVSVVPLTMLIYPTCIAKLLLMLTSHFDHFKNFKMVRTDIFDFFLFETDLNNWFVIRGLVLLQGRGKRKWPGGATEEDTKNSSDFCQLGHRCLLRGRHYQKLPSLMSKCKLGMTHYINCCSKSD